MCNQRGIKTYTRVDTTEDSERKFERKRDEHNSKKFTKYDATKNHCHTQSVEIAVKLMSENQVVHNQAVILSDQNYSL